MATVAINDSMHDVHHHYAREIKIDTLPELEYLLKQYACMVSCTMLE